MRREIIVRLATGWLLLVGGAGCGGIFPVTAGVHNELPEAGTKVVVWGNSAATVETVTTWLLRLGIAVVEHAMLQERLDERDIRWTQTLRDEVAVLRAARELGAKHVVFVNRQGDIRSPVVLIRGVNVESGRVAWAGSARYDGYRIATPLHDSLTILSCHALGTAWGIRPPGQRWLWSDDAMCHIEPNWLPAPEDREATSP